MLRHSSYAASLLLPLTVMGRGNNDGWNAENAFSIQLRNDDNGNVWIHNWWVEEEGTWRIYGEIEMKLTKSASVGTYFNTKWVIYQHSDGRYDGVDATIFPAEVEGNTRPAEDIIFVDIRGSEEDFLDDSKTSDKDPSRNWANATPFWVQDCTAYNFRMNYECSEVRYRFYRNFQTKQENQDYQFWMDDAYCTGDWYTWLQWDGQEDPEYFEWYPLPICIPEERKNLNYDEGTWTDPIWGYGAECVDERIQFPQVVGSSENGSMNQEEGNRRTLLLEDETVKLEIHCNEDTWFNFYAETINFDDEENRALVCKVQIELKPCKGLKKPEIQTAFELGINGETWWDIVHIMGVDLGTEDAQVYVTDMSRGESYEPKNDQLNPRDDRSVSPGWELVYFNDQFVRDLDGTMRGYLEVDIWRGFQTSQPTEDVQIDKNELNCDKGYFVAGWYNVNGQEYLGPRLSFIPSMGCLQCEESGRCSPPEIVQEPAKAPVKAPAAPVCVRDGDKPYCYVGGAMAAAASLGAATTALALLMI